jgi:hypothetical protein
MLGYFISLFRTINVLAFRSYKDAQKAATCIFCSEKIVLLKSEVCNTLYNVYADCTISVDKQTLFLERPLV